MFTHFGVTRPHFDERQTLVTSPFFGARGLAILRLVIAFYIFSTLLYAFLYESVVLFEGTRFFSYFTHLSFIGLCAYFFAAGIQSWMANLGIQYGIPCYPLQKRGRFLQLCHVLLLSTAVTFPILVTGIYWTLLSGPDTFENLYHSWATISMHLLNTVFALSEIVLTNIPVLPWLTLVPNVIFLMLYVCVAYITHATQGFYVYPFLDPSTGKLKLALYLVGIPVLECLIFGLVQLAILGRQKATKRVGERLTSVSEEVPLLQSTELRVTEVARSKETMDLDV